MRTKARRSVQSTIGNCPLRSLPLAALMVGTLFAAANPALAQSGGGYNIKKSTIDSGGGTVTGGGYKLSGTVGQHDAGDPTGGGYVLTGGFWSPAVGGQDAGVIVWDPATNPTPWPNSNSDAATRSLKFKVTGEAALNAIQVTMVDLQNPQPPNAICCPPKDFHTYESATCTGDPVPGGGCARWVGKPGT
ncbi:MAG: hypothetical protein V1790_05500, partial [Planctomycetota bacterium]